MRVAKTEAGLAKYALDGVSHRPRFFLTRGKRGQDSITETSPVRMTFEPRPLSFFLFLFSWPSQLASPLASRGSLKYPRMTHREAGYCLNRALIGLSPHF